MHCQVIILVLIGVVGVTMSAPVKAPEYLSAEEEWVKYKENFKKNYSKEEDQKRFNLFKENLQKIKEHNEKFKKGETTFTQGINQFSDMTHDEFKQGCCGLKRPETIGKQ